MDALRRVDLIVDELVRRLRRARWTAARDATKSSLSMFPCPCDRDRMLVNAFVEKHVAPFARDAFVAVGAIDAVETGIVPRAGYMLLLLKPDIAAPPGWVDRGVVPSYGAVRLRCYSRAVESGDRAIFETLEVIGERLGGVVACDR